ncbi:anibiotic ABC transporter efflux pump [Nocardiopsis tropica]|uniref:Anibiotic ABC transporter efflux pump n=1 Tax=Nocardiopsis tropica TaxID=109330 RepID=A0ABU7KLN4_9ACTN|nr:anibiotic ABC transporter efflux pump [Nocardiopsis umidischolae]MEE2050209.1 anibiotic ABC transporter efflux pump [Nocardiopsis umidischolae]
MSALTGTGTLIRFVLLRDRVRIGVWTAAVVGTVAATVPALDGMFATDAQRQARAALMDTPTGIVFGGPGYGLDDYQLGPMVVNELTMSVLIALAVMNILHVVRHTRAEEESGRAELLRAGVLGSGAQTTAALATAAGVNALIGALVTAVLLAGGLEPADSAAFGAGLALAGVSFAAVAAVTSQVVEHGRSASGLAFAAVGVLFLFRVAGDMAEQGGSTLSWLSPFAWVQQTRMYDDLRWWPLGLYPVLVAALFAAAFALAGRRDLGSGLVAARPGPTGAGRLLGGTFALHLHQQRGAVLAWTAAAFLFSFAFGTLATEVDGMLAENPDLAAVLGDAADDVTAGFLGMMVSYVLMAASAYAVVSVMRTRAEESSGRAELTLSTAVGRVRWFGTALLVSVLSSALIVVAGGFGMGLGASAATEDPSWTGTLTGAALAQLPTALMFVALTALLVGAAPRLAPLAWAWLAYGVLVSVFGGLLDLDDRVMGLSAFEMMPRLPVEEFDPVPVSTALGAVLAVGALALAGFRRRDLATA